RRVPGVEPEGVDAELTEVRQPGPDPGEVTDSVAVRVGEAADVDLVDDRVAPPGPVGAPGAPLAWEGVRRGGRQGADRVQLCHVGGGYCTPDICLQDFDGNSQESVEFLQTCARWRLAEAAYARETV